MPKNKTDNRTVENKMDDKLDIQTNNIISGIKQELLCTERNEYSTSHLFKYLMKSNLKIFFKELAEESLKMPVWKYNEICYPAINDKRVTDYAVDKSKTEGDIEVIICSKDMPYILD